MKSLRLMTVIVGATLLAGCSAGLDVGNNFVRAQPKTAPTHGDTPVVIRSYGFDAETPGNRGAEVAGATCNVTSQHFSATVRTPVSLTVPLYGIGTPTLTVSCSMSGTGSGSLVVSPYNKSRADMISAGANAGLAGLLLMGAVAAASDASQQQYLYPLEIPVTLKPQ